MTAPRSRPLSCPSCAQRFRRSSPKLRDLLHQAPLDGRPVNRRLHWCDDAGVPLCDVSVPDREAPTRFLVVEPAAVQGGVGRVGPHRGSPPPGGLVSGGA